MVLPHLQPRDDQILLLGLAEPRKFILLALLTVLATVGVEPVSH
jgi:hypothetical protein